MDRIYLRLLVVNLNFYHVPAVGVKFPEHGRLDVVQYIRPGPNPCPCVELYPVDV